MEEVQQALAVLFVLGILGGTLFWLRRRGVATFSWKATGGAAARKVQVIERVPLSAQHSLHLVRMGDRELLIGVSPGGCTLLESRETAGMERTNLK